MLATAALVVTLFVAVAHVGFMVLETFLWTGPTGRRIFAMTPEQAEQTKVLAQNQGVYNGGLAVLLAWAALSGQGPMVMALLAYIVVMGLYGGLTAKWTIILFQALPAGIALALTALA